MAVVRDDGDVDAFLIRHVLQAIERRTEPGISIGIVADEIKPLFQSNVGISAWGLAIHSEARILATSSNAREVRVFKFGLLQTGDESHDGDDEALPDTDGSDVDQSRQRKTDVTLHVLNGDANIPHIAFCNTGDDPEARWLMTTDISGMCRVMDLHELHSVQAFRFGRSFASHHSGGFDRLNAGWAIAFLDRRSFRSENSVHIALGMGDGERLPGVERNHRIWDLSKTVQGLPESSEPFVYHRPKRREQEHRTSPNSSHEDDSMRSPSADYQQQQTERPTSSGRSASVEIEIDVSEDMHGDEDEDEDGGVEVEVTETIQEEDDSQAQSGSQISDHSDGLDEDLTAVPWDSESEADYDPLVLVDDYDDPEDEGTEDSLSYTSYYNGESICGNEPRFLHPNTTLCEDLPCPILHASVRNIYLLQPSNQHHGQGAGPPPMVGLANPLRQMIQQDFEYLRIFERLNMHAYIPTLGIIILASQKGRALVLALTKVAANAQCPPEMQRHTPKTNYAMRVECILPFADQEKANQRPFAPLHGIAVSPLQGSEEMKQHQKRWRLVMMYQDHSILSYEIGRGRAARDSGVAVESLVI